MIEQRMRRGRPPSSRKIVAFFPGRAKRATKVGSRRLGAATGSQSDIRERLNRHRMRKKGLTGERELGGVEEFNNSVPQKNGETKEHSGEAGQNRAFHLGGGRREGTTFIQEDEGQQARLKFSLWVRNQRRFGKPCNYWEIKIGLPSFKEKGRPAKTNTEPCLLVGEVTDRVRVQRVLSSRCRK